MSGERPQTVLQFSLVFAAFQFVFMGAAGAGFVYLASRYWFHFDEVLAHPTRRRHAWLTEVANTNDGKTGVIICLGLALLAGWYGLKAGRRFLSRGKAAVLTEAGLKVHPTYRRIAEIPFADIQWARVSRGRMFVHILEIGIASGRPITIASKEIEGGKSALKRFRKQLIEARGEVLQK